LPGAHRADPSVRPAQTILFARPCHLSVARGHHLRKGLGLGGRSAPRCAPAVREAAVAVTLPNPGPTRFPRPGTLPAGYSVPAVATATTTDACPPTTRSPAPSSKTNLSTWLKGNLNPRPAHLVRDFASGVARALCRGVDPRLPVAGEPTCPLQQVARIQDPGRPGPCDAPLRDAQTVSRAPAETSVGSHASPSAWAPDRRGFSPRPVHPPPFHQPTRQHPGQILRRPAFHSCSRDLHSGTSHAPTRSAGENSGNRHFRWLQIKLALSRSRRHIRRT